MDSQEKLLAAIIVILVAVAIYISFAPAQPTEKDDAHAMELIKTAVEVGKGQDEYYYSFREVSDDYTIEYVLFQKGGEKMISIDNPFAYKEVYFLENETILCEDFAGVETCSSVKNNTNAYFLDYLESLKSRFFSDEAIEDENEMLDYFYEKGYLIVQPETTQKTVDGRTCEEVKYTMDYTNISLSEANRFRLPTAGPDVFDFTICVDNRTGLAYTKHFEYYYEGEDHEWDFTLLEADWSPSQDIVPPENLSAGAYDSLIEEKTWQAKYQKCDVWTGENKDNCISDIALTLKSKEVCMLAGTWKDRCLLTVASLTGDDSICPEIENTEYRDDCYIEMAYYTKDDSYCSNIADTSKIEICNEAAEPGNQTGIPNPAAVNCADNGYDYEIKTDNETGGQYGVCMHEGLECEEWALYNGECCLTSEDCSEGACIEQVCAAEGTPGNDTNSTTLDMEKFMNELENETNSTESS